MTALVFSVLCMRSLGWGSKTDSEANLRNLDVGAQSLVLKAKMDLRDHGSGERVQEVGGS